MNIFTTKSPCRASRSKSVVFGFSVHGGAATGVAGADKDQSTQGWNTLGQKVTLGAFYKSSEGHEVKPKTGFSSIQLRGIHGKEANLQI